MKALFSDEPTLELQPDEISLTGAGILIVDEDPAFQLGLKTFLKEYVGFEKVFTARNGKEAIEMIGREESIELLTVDFQMPVMDGMEMLKVLRRNTPRPLGVTMITGFPSEELKRDFAKLTSSKLLTTHFLSKPVEFEKLEPVILDSYEELKRSQQLTKTMTGGESSLFSVDDPNLMGSASSNRELMAKINLLEEKLEENTRVIRDTYRSRFLASFFADIVKLLLAAMITYAAWQSGLIAKLSTNQPGASLEQVTPSARAVPVAPVLNNPPQIPAALREE